MGYREFSFEGLEVYKTARLLVRDVYRLQQKFPQTETYALGDQIRRSASSVTSNIAEGSGRRTGGRVPVSRIIGVSINQ